MIKLFARKAATAPGSEAFHIHQVVATFQMNILIYTSPKNLPVLFTLVSIHSKGIQAIKIRKVNDDTGQAAKSNKPASRARRRLEYFGKGDFL
jgi:hypothetical protein